MDIKIKKITLPKKIKDNFEKYLSRKNIEFTYLNGYITEFTNTNMSTISPHKIIMKGKEKEIVILYYGQYLYDEELYFINESTNPCNFATLRKIVTNYMK